MSALVRSHGGEFGVLARFRQINWLLILLLVATASVGFAVLYSAGGGSFQPWAGQQMIRFAFGMVLLFAAALVDIRFWLRTAYLVYLAALLLLIAVEIMGDIGMGAQRWLDLGFINLQPSEVMKIALVLALARYFSARSHEDVGRVLVLIPPVAMVLVPVGLVLIQPDLGTAAKLGLGAAAIFFVAGVRWWKFALVGAAGAAAVPVAWEFMHEYQRQRIYTFLNPETDPLGTGYHILQSQIALGSGGIFGKGYLQGTQSQLNFLPEKQTDFIFTMLAEELGLVGGIGLLALYFGLIAFGVAIALRTRSHFARLVAIGFTTSFFLYVFINSAMVMGIVPVVGVPLPLISYGGTAMLTVLFGFGLLMNAYIHRDAQLGRRDALGED